MSILNLINETLHKPHGLSLENLQKLAGIDEKAASQAQQQAAGAALSIKKGESDSEVEPSATMAKTMSTKELEKIAGTKHKGLPKKIKKEEVVSEELTPAPDPKHKIKEKPYDHYKVSTEENQEVKQVYRVRYDDQSEEYVELAKEEFVELKRLTPSHFIKSIVALDEKPEGVKLTTFAKVKKKADSLPDGEVAPHLTPEREKLKEVLKKEIRKILAESGL